MLESVDGRCLFFFLYNYGLDGISMPITAVVLAHLLNPLAAMISIEIIIHACNLEEI